MKYANETEVIEGYLIDLENDVLDWEFEGQMPSHQIHKIKTTMGEIRKLLDKRYPLKAKKKMKDLDTYIYYCNKPHSYNYFDELQRDSYYAY